MFKTITIIILIILSSISTAISNNKQGNKMSTEQLKVLNVIHKMTTAFHNSDIKGVMASYEQNATVVFEPGKPVSDATMIQKMFNGAFTLNPKFSYSGHEVFISGDIAVHYAPWTMKGTAPDGTVVKQSGLSVAVLRRQANGTWLMVIDNPHGQNLMNQ